MSFSAFIGLILGIAIVISAMAMGSSIAIFINIPGMLIVIGGTIAAMMIRYSVKEAFHAIGLSFQILLPNKEIDDNGELIELTDDLIRVARLKGLLALETVEVNNSFYQHGIRMLVDGYDHQLIKESMREENQLFVERTEKSAAVFYSIGSAAPAFGMVGTLVGLIQMLANLSDPSSIGPAMAVAMLTTLYGALIANMFALPMADKMSVWVQEEAIRQQLMIEAIFSIADGENPNVMRDRLSPFLENKKTTDATQEG